MLGSAKACWRLGKHAKMWQLLGYAVHDRECYEVLGKDKGYLASNACKLMNKNV